MDNISANQMPHGLASRIVIYLLALTILTGAWMVSLWSAEPKPPSDTVNEAKCQKDSAPTLNALDPSAVNAGSPVGDIMLLGCNFSDNLIVKLNGASHPMLRVDKNHIRVGLTGSDVAAAGTIIVSVAGKDSTGTDIGSKILRVVQPRLEWKALPWVSPWSITEEVRLLLLVLFTGAFASCIYALKSFADYRGDNKLYESWTAYYYVQPLEGAGIAFLLYLVIRGGFLAGGAADITSANVYGICAIAGLAGAFSDIAFLKLREVFQILFKPQDNRGGKMDAPSIDTTSLPEGTVGKRYEVALKASGGTPPRKWSVAPDLPAGLGLDADTGVISGTPEKGLPKTKYRITVKDSTPRATSVHAELELEIKPAGQTPSTGTAGQKLNITTASLPSATSGKPFKEVLNAAGGSGALTWSVQGTLPAGLALDSATGVLSGTPQKPLSETAYIFTVTDSAKSPSTHSKELKLKVE